MALTLVAAGHLSGLGFKVDGEPLSRKKKPSVSAYVLNRCSRKQKEGVNL